jgi:2-methylisocitrate lyase-like PEP mutase family enzyme
MDSIFSERSLRRVDRSQLNRKADIFRSLHDRTRILVLPNAWDAAGARIFEEAGFPAIATTSAGIAWALGYPDGERIGRDKMAEFVGRICRAVAVPVTAEMEGGYGPAPSDVAATVQAVIAAGAVGLNLEDARHDSESELWDMAGQVERIRPARAAAESAGVRLVINARTDVYLHSVGAESERFDHAVRRANAYREAGADCLFIPGVRDAAVIGALAQAVNGPINILAGPGTPPIPELQKLGVARVSVGSGPMRAALTLLRRIAEDLRGSGDFTSFGRDVVSHAEVNRLLTNE